MDTHHMEFPPALMTRELAAYYLSVSTRELDEIRNRGELIARSAGKRVKHKRSELDRYIDRLPERHS